MQACSWALLHAPAVRGELASRPAGTFNMQPEAPALCCPPLIPPIQCCPPSNSPSPHFPSPPPSPPPCPQAKYFSLPEEYRRNPHFNHLMALHYQSLLGAGPPGAGGGGTGAGTPAPATDAAPTRGATPAAGETGEAAAAAAAAGSRGGAVSGASSEAADMDQG